jgi:Rrf2 family transcriptional regulator, cysteine metabolism repressor
MRLTQASRYAIRALVLIGAHENNGFMTSEHIAGIANISEMFLLKALKPLVSAGILRSLKGPGGGYQMARAPKEVTLLQVVEAVDGPIRGELTFQQGVKPGDLDRRLQAVCNEVADRYRSQLQKVRLSELIKSR